MDHAVPTPIPKDRSKKKRKSIKTEEKIEGVVDEYDETKKGSIAGVEHEDDGSVVDAQDEDNEPEEEQRERTPTTLERIQEILKPTLKIPESKGPYSIPDAVKAGDVNVLREIDERKIIELKEVFTLFDTDADGLISSEDLRATFIALGKDPTPQTIEQMLTEAMSPLDFDAFVALMGYKMIELDPEDVLLEAWSKWDSEGTGLICEERCIDQIHIFPHLYESVLQNPGEPEETICSENSKYFDSTETENLTIIRRPQSFQTATSNLPSNNIESSQPTDNIVVIPQPLTRTQFRINHRPAIFSSNRVLGMRLIYRPFFTEDAFKVIGRFQFIDKAMFKNDGNLVATTYCDYQFLPPAINYAVRGGSGIAGNRALGNDGRVGVKPNRNDDDDNEDDSWRYFYSPRYPAKYPDHIKCTYKFIGRPRNRVEVIFEEIYLLTGQISCLHNSDKITVYDSKMVNMSSIIDVFCNERPSMKVISSGPNLLIEFEASSNRTSNGFSAKYRFIDIFAKAKSDNKPTKLNDIIIAPMTSTTIHPQIASMSPDSYQDIAPHVIYKSDHLKSLSGQSTQTTNKKDENNEVQQLNSTLDDVVLVAVVTETRTTGNGAEQTIGVENSAGSRISNGVRICPPGT